MRLALLLVPVILLAACDGGSKDFVQENYKLQMEWKQGPAGAVGIAGTTDLPEGSEIDAVVTTFKDPAKAINGAVLNGSTRSPGSQPVKKPKGQDLSRFFLVMDNPLAETCKRQPPCGPFPAGEYYILVDAKTPTESSQGVTVDNDPRFRAQTNGYGGFAGVEVVLTAKLMAIQIHLDETGRPVNPAQVVAEPTPSPSPSPSPTAPASAPPPSRPAASPTPRRSP